MNPPKFIGVALEIDEAKAILMAGKVILSDIVRVIGIDPVRDMDLAKAIVKIHNAIEERETK